MNRKLPLRGCPHEPELRTLLTLGQWPAAAPAELRTHVAACRACSEIALLTTSFQASRATASASAQLPPPGLLWWRAQLQRRNHALERINRPLAGAQMFAIASISVLFICFALFIRADLRDWMDSERNSSHFTASSTHLLSTLSATYLTPAYLLPALALVLLAGGIALYIAHEPTEGS